ncbi:Acetoacetate-CoA ligase [Fusarium sp. Ph1]|nr:Acetoacetate-CoA ligase [Fusarium sp. Ph1]
MVSSTGMIFLEALFEWFYDVGFPPYVRVNNQSGGTDIAGCFGISNALTPVYSGGCAGLSLGIPVEIYDIMFWGIGGQDKYYEAYFAHFDGVWMHGDFVMIYLITKYLFFLSRSDGILNLSGV